MRCTWFTVNLSLDLCKAYLQKSSCSEITCWYLICKRSFFHKTSDISSQKCSQKMGFRNFLMSQQFPNSILKQILLLLDACCNGAIFKFTLIECTVSLEVLWCILVISDGCMSNHPKIKSAKKYLWKWSESNDWNLTFWIICTNSLQQLAVWPHLIIARPVNVAW